MVTACVLPFSDGLGYNDTHVFILLGYIASYNYFGVIFSVAS